MRNYTKTLYYKLLHIIIKPEALLAPACLLNRIPRMEIIKKTSESGNNSNKLPQYFVYTFSPRLVNVIRTHKEINTFSVRNKFNHRPEPEQITQRNRLFCALLLLSSVPALSNPLRPCLLLKFLRITSLAIKAKHD